MKKYFDFFVFIAITGLFIYILQGCSSGKEKKTTTETDTIEYVEEESMTEIEELTLPADFPNDIPVYPDGEVEMVHKIHPDSIWHFEFAVKEDLDKVASFFKEELTKNGWQIEGEAGSAELEVIALNMKKDKRTVLFDLRPDERYSDDLSESWAITFVRMDYYPLGYFD